MQELFILEDLLNVLIELETLANKHYLEMAKATDDTELKALFTRLAALELDHKELFIRYKSKAVNFTTSNVTAEYTSYMDALLKNTIDFLKNQGGTESFEEGFNLAVKLEKDTIFFLAETKLIITKEFHGEVDNIMDQEREHLRALLEYNRS